MWANTELVDTEGDNLMHEVAHEETYRMDPEDKIRCSALGLRPVPLCDVTHLYNLENLGYDRALEFMSRVRSADATPGPEAPGDPNVGSSDDTTPQGKATDKCRPKSSTKVPESANPQLDVTNETGETIESQEAEASEAVGEADDAELIADEETQDDVPLANMTSNEVRELIHGLMRKSSILDECRTRVRSAVSKAVAERTKEMFKPFTGYIEDMARKVSSWHAGILSVRPKMVDCNYEAYHENSGLIREKTNAFYERARVLNKSLDESMASKPAVKDDSGTSGAEVGDAEDPFQVQIPDIMTDVEESVTKYADEMAKKVLEHTGGADISSYLGHIFSTGLNFQTSMWQLVTFEAVYLPTVMREHLLRDASTLRLFVECLPMLAPCAIPPLPFPVILMTSAVKAPPLSATKVSRPPSMSVMAGAMGSTGVVKAVPTSSAPQGPTTTSQKPVAASRVKLKVSPAATNSVLDKAVGCMTPVRDTHSILSQSSVPSGHLAGLAQASSNIRSRLRDSISPNSQPTVKRPRLDGAAKPTTTTSSAPGSSSAAAIAIDEDEDEIQFIDADGDGDSVHVNAQGRQMTTSSSSSLFVLQSLDDELLTEYPE